MDKWMFLKSICPIFSSIPLPNVWNSHWEAKLRWESFLGTLSNIFLKPEKFSQWSIYWVSVGLWNTKAPPITVISDNSLRLWLAFSRCEKPERQFNLVPSEEQGFLCPRILCESAFHLLRCLKIPHVRSQNYFRSIAFFSSYFITQ